MTNMVQSHEDTLFENHPKLIFEFWHFPPIFVRLKLTCLVTLFDRKLQVFNNLPIKNIGCCFTLCLLYIMITLTKNFALRALCNFGLKTKNCKKNFALLFMQFSVEDKKF